MIDTQVALTGGATVTEQLHRARVPGRVGHRHRVGERPAHRRRPGDGPRWKMLRPGGRPVAVKVYGPPVPPLPVIVTGVIATPWTAMMDTQVALTGGATVTEQFTVPVLPAESVTVTV